MLGKTAVKVLVIGNAVLIIAGLFYAAIAPEILIGPILVVISITISGLLIKLHEVRTLKATVGMKGVGMRNLSAIGDAFLLVGLLLGIGAINFLDLPTKEARGVALIIPALIFAGGVLMKIVFYVRKQADK